MPVMLMNFEIRRDFAALQFIRVTAPLPGLDGYAGGAGVSVGIALAKCRSEFIERSFEISELRSHGIKPVGIAAHPDFNLALQAAYWEAVESHFVSKVAKTGIFQGRAVWSAPAFKWWLVKLAPTGCFSIIIAKLNGVDLVVSSAKPTLIATLFKTWEEYRNPISNCVSAANLSNYTKAMQLLGPQGGSALGLELASDRLIAPALTDFVIHRDIRDGHHIVYLTKPKKEGIKL